MLAGFSGISGLFNWKQGLLLDSFNNKKKKIGHISELID